MDFAAVTDELASRLAIIDGLSVFNFEVPTVTGESAFFGYPHDYDFHQTYDGAERFKLPVVVVVPNPTQRNTRDKLAKYCTGSGEFSIKEAIESEVIPAVSFSTVLVESIDFDEVTIAGTAYAGAIFTIDITG
jgi:hypothetical protein